MRSLLFSFMFIVIVGGGVALASYATVQWFAGPAEVGTIHVPTYFRPAR